MSDPRGVTWKKDDKPFPPKLPGDIWFDEHGALFMLSKDVKTDVVGDVFWETPPHPMPPADDLGKE